MVSLRNLVAGAVVYDSMGTVWVRCTRGAYAVDPQEDSDENGPVFYDDYELETAERNWGPFGTSSAEAKQAVKEEEAVFEP